MPSARSTKGAGPLPRDLPPPIPVRIRRLPHGEGLPLPDYASAEAAGMDVRAAVSEPLELTPGAIARVPTGFALEVPTGWEVQLRPRSGLAAGAGVTLANSPATIDSDYRGEIFVALIHHGRETLRI